MTAKAFDIRPRARKQSQKETPTAESLSVSRKRKKKTKESPELSSGAFAPVEESLEYKITREEFLEHVTQPQPGGEPISSSAKQRPHWVWVVGKAIRVLVLVIFCAGVLYGLGSVLARVNIKMTVSQAVQEDVFSIRLTRLNPKAATSSGLFFEETKKTFSYTQSYSATGKGQATGYAKGIITVENSYSAQSMRFVAGTRFRDDKGQVFRTQQAITIPGYTKTQDKIVPGEVAVEVKADNAGEAGNLSSGTILRVVVFEGTDKYKAIAGVVKDAFTGGAQGETTLVTAEDIQNAKQQIVEYAFAQAKAEVLQSLPEGTQVLDRALQLKITKTTVKAAAGDSVPSFKATVAGELKIRFFDERQIRQYLESQMESVPIKNELVSSELQLSYENVSSSFDTNEMTMQIRARRVLTPVLDTLAFRQRIAGKTISEVRVELLKLEGLEKVDISVWPFWLSRVPANVDSIHIVME